MALNPTTAGAKAILQAQLRAWGLGVLADKAWEIKKQGYGDDAVMLQLSETKEYQQRFSANQQRVAKGLAALTPGDYIAAENSYRQVLQQYGLPSGFYDHQDDFHNFIANDVSPTEVKDRATVAQQVWLSKDDATKQAWKSYYGLSDGAAIASILDPHKALPVVQRMAAAAQIGGAAHQNGLTNPTAQRAEQLADLGVTQQAAQKGYGQIAATLGDVQASASRFGTSFTQTDAENAQLLGQGPALRKQADIAAAEKALFGSRASADQNTEVRRASGSY